ncbi:MAG: hypothetical protein JSS11_11465 [Verrucomicrobia bacterium]|nr:hypothetical protein [Verrucomicrobiota bacterium]
MPLPRLTLALAFLFSVLACSAAPAPRPVIAGPILNEDSTQFFFEHTPAQMCGETVDAFIDQIADSGYRTFISCVNAQKANYASKVWEPDWSHYDPAGPDDQPVLKHLTPAGIKMSRQRLDAAKRLADLGINFHARALARCRARGIGAWVSVRVNDLHDCLLEDSPLLGEFFKAQRAAGQLRATYRGGDWWADRGLDWERPEVQEHYFALVKEQLETLDLDGLELDWMRFVWHFRPGHELEGGKVITAWMRRVRAECDKAAARLGHPVLLGVRVPSRPETARRCGLDGVAWAHEGLVDLVVPTPFWSTTDFDIPVTEWKRLLAGTRTTLAPGIEIRYQPVPNAPAEMMSPALVVGASLPLLHAGADAVYFFNYDPFPLYDLPDTRQPGTDQKLWTPATYAATFHALRSAATLAAQPRLHAVTFHDVRAPGDPADAALPATDTRADFPWPPGCAIRIATGPKPTTDAELHLQFTADSTPEKVRLFINSRELPAPTAPGIYKVPAALLQDEAQVIEIVSAPGTKFSVTRVELSVPASK